jgi:L-asparaginase
VTASSRRPRIAVFSGPTSTIQNTPPLVTSNLARRKYGLPLLTNADGTPASFDALRAQRLAAPVTVYVEQFSAHPLERDAAALYGPPDGYLDVQGVFARDRRNETDTPVYEIVLRPEDGLYPLPYMARQADGKPWDDDGAVPFAPAHRSRQPFFPDASRLFEEIDRFGVSGLGMGNLLRARADFDFYRAAPSGGYTLGQPENERTDVGTGDIPPEVMNQDFFAYRPYHLRSDATRAALARATTLVQQTMGAGDYDGAIWLEGSPTVEETSYWLTLLIDTRAPIAANAAQRTHGQLGSDGDRNIVDSVTYILSRIWADGEGKDQIGCVVVQDQVVYAARDVQKADARPGGYTTTGGHGGVVAAISDLRPPILTYRPARRHTHLSDLNVHRLPDSVEGVRRTQAGLTRVPVTVKSGPDVLLATAIPLVSMVKTGQYAGLRDAEDAGIDVAVAAQIEHNLREEPLAGFVAEGWAPYGSLTAPVEKMLRRALFTGMPVAVVGRGNAEGFTPRTVGGFFIGGSNLTATKARILLMAALLRLGSLPSAADPDHPTSDEIAAMRSAVARYQDLFDQH